MSSIDRSALLDLAMSKLEYSLKGYGNRLSSEHENALKEIIQSYIDMATGKLKGRHAFPLFPGGGKTTSIVAFLSAVYELGYSDISVVICVSRVEAQCGLKRNLIKNGIPEEHVGLIHSYEYSPITAKHYLDDGEPLPEGYSSEASTENNSERQFVLVTHNRVKGRDNHSKYNWYNGSPRAFAIWDESLIHSKSNSVPLTPLKGAIGYFKPLHKDKTPETNDAIAYVEKAIKLFNRELKYQRDGYEPKITKLPELTKDQIVRFKALFSGSEIFSPIRKLFEISQNALRVVNTGIQDGGVLQYEIVIPEELKNIIILDASHPIRDLVSMDTTITSDAKYPDNIVSYENVEIRHLKHAAGRTKITECFSKKKEDRLLALELVEVVKHIPADEGVLFFTFKPRSGNGRVIDFREIIERHMTDAGIDIQANLDDGQPRFAWLTHGNETSLSTYSYCRNVIFVGALHMSHIDISAQMAGQSNNLLEEMCPKIIQDVTESEVAYCLHQGMTRSACRIVDDGKAQAAKIWLIYPKNKIKERIASVMPGVQWKTWETKHLMMDNKMESIAKKIGLFLSQEISKRFSDRMFFTVSTREIRKNIDVEEDIASSTFTRAVKHFVSGSKEWNKSSRSLMYIGD